MLYNIKCAKFCTKFENDSNSQTQYIKTPHTALSIHCRPAEYLALISRRNKKTLGQSCWP